MLLQQPRLLVVAGAYNTKHYKLVAQRGSSSVAVNWGTALHHPLRGPWAPATLGEQNLLDQFESSSEGEFGQKRCRASDAVSIEVDTVAPEAVPLFNAWSGAITGHLSQT